MRRTQLIRSSKRNLFIEKLELRSLFAADFVAGELLIQYESDYASDVGASNAAQGAQVLQDLALTNADSQRFARVRFPAGHELGNAIESYRRTPGVLSAEYNWRVTKSAVSNDPMYSNGSHWGMYSDDQPTAYGETGTTNPFGSGAEVAWGRDFVGSSQIVIGVIDEGIDINHEDLRNNIWTNPNEVPNDGIDNDLNGFIDDVNGWDFINRDNTVFDAGDVDDHGTHVAGTIGAVGGNGVGVAGVSWNVKILPGKFLGPNGGSISDAILAIDYMTNLKVNHGVNIVALNNSWGGTGYSSALHAAVIRAANAGILFVAAAGNSSVDNDVYLTYPASYSTLEPAEGQPAATYDSVISVAALTSTGDMAGYSNWGFNSVDIGAPGTSIVSTLPGNTYGTYSGTSMAAPHVTGAIALYEAAMPTETPAGVREAIIGSTVQTSSLLGKVATGGRLNINNALNYMSLPALSISSVSLLEGATGQTPAMNFSVVLSSPVAETFTVQFATSDRTAISGSDYRAASGVLTFNPGETTKSFSVTLLGDDTIEAAESFAVALSNLSTRSVRIGAGVALGSILDDDQRGLVISDSVVMENAGLARFTVSLLNQPNATVSVRFATASGTARAGKNSDFMSTSGTLNFAPGETFKHIFVTINNDRLIESNEIFYVNLSSPSGTTIQDAQGVGVIQDDDSTTSTDLSHFAFSPDSLSASDWLSLTTDYSRRRGRR